MIGVMGFLGGGWNFVIFCFLCYFNIISIIMFDDIIMIKIFGRIMEWYFIIR